MKNALLILSIFIISCSETASNKTYSYTEEQNLFLESIGWAGFEPSFIKTTSLTKNLHVIFGYGGNILVSIGKDGTLIVDSQFPDISSVILEKINELGGEKVDFIINTHFHFDHAEGNRAYGPMGANIYAHENTLDYFKNGTYINLVSIVWPQQPYEEEAIPDILYKEKLSLNINDHMIEVLHFGPAHTTGDSIIYFKDANVIHLGDVGNLEVAPFIDVDNGGSIHGMIHSLEKVLNIINEKTIVVPGHGEIADKSIIENYLKNLIQVKNKIQILISEGKTLLEIQEINPALEYFPVGPELLNDRVFTSLSK
jgi:cyclase|tara:strand:- start:110 stop:1045 length:936 start_codon:yes stop_codon:yes gene_type:complete